MIDDAHGRPNPLAAATDQQFLRVLSVSEQPLSRAEIADRSGISKPAISDAAVRLERSALIVDAGVRAGRRGGVATLYRINAARGHSLAVAVQPHGVAARGRDLEGKMLFDRVESLSPHAESHHVIALANDLIDASMQVIDTPLMSAALSVAVPVERTTGDTLRLPNSSFPAGWFNPLRELNLASDVPAVVDNDVNWATLAERHLGSMTDCDDFVYVFLGTGIGAGIYSSGQLQRGYRGLAGEMGYLRDAEGRDLTQSLAHLGLGADGAYGLDVGLALARFTECPIGDSEVQALEVLAMAISNAAILLNPRAIVLGGPLAQSARFVDGLRTRIRQLALDPPEVVASTHAPLEGASFEAHRIARARFGF